MGLKIDIKYHLNLAIGWIIAASISGAMAGTLSPIVTFNGNNGRLPESQLTVDAAGNLYGTTFYGGAADYGTAFKLSTGANPKLTSASFNFANGAYPTAGLILDPAGNVYGVTASGGTVGAGAIFRFNTSTSTVSMLASFSNGNGADPYGTLVEGSDGKLYGTTNYRGPTIYGTLYGFDPQTNLISTLVSFNGSNGAYPVAQMIADRSGNLLGTTNEGGPYSAGTIFKFNTVSGAFKTLASFDNSNGENPYASSVVKDAAGNLYGTTYNGGANNDGTIFKYNAATGTLTALLSFDGINGSFPHGGLISDAQGNLYGTTETGGVNNVGNIFEFNPNTLAITTLASFDNVSTGTYPSSRLVADSAGNLFGIAQEGGSGNDGTLFELSDSGFVVPEPTAMGLLLVAGIATLHRRRAR